MNLAKGAIRTMFVNKVLTTGVAALLAAGVIATGAAVYAYQAAKPDPAIARPGEVVKREQPAVANSDDGLLTVTGIVRMRDGSPVAGASVRSITGSDEHFDRRPHGRCRPVSASGVCLVTAVACM